jgi:tetratricopeptide (TPR) repeat protein
MMMIYGIISLILLEVWFIMAKNKSYRLIIFGTAWFFLFILLTLIKPMDTTPEFSENRIYLPMFGFAFIFLGLGRIKFRDKSNNITQKKIFLGISVALIITFSFVTIYRNKYYKNKLNFWNNAVETSPSFAFNHNNLGAMFFLDGKKNEAEKEFNKALEINPRERMAHNNLGLVYLEKGDFSKAEEEFNKELEINPYYDNAYANKGLLYYRMGRMDEAVDSWKKTLEVNPGYSQALYNLFIYYYQNQDKENAKYWAQEAQNREIPLLPEMQKMLNPLDSIILNK